LSGSVPVQTGWNLIGLPVQTVSRVVLGEGLSETMFSWNAQASTYSILPAEPDALNHDLGTARGIWIYSFTPSALHFAGTGQPPADLQLQIGWNLVCGQTFRAADSGFTPIGGTRVGLVDAVSSQVPPPPGGYAFQQVFLYDPATSGYQALDLGNADTRVLESQGFWIYVHQAGTLHLRDQD